MYHIVARMDVYGAEIMSALIKRYGYGTNT